MAHTTQTHQIGDNAELMRKMEPETFDTIITSPPYWGLRDYGVDGQIGLEPTLKEYHARMLEVTAECMRVLKPTGVMFWNHGDSYGGSGGSGGDYAEGGLREGQPKVGSGGGIAKCMAMQNERLIIRMIDDQGWILRNRIIWNKPNGMPSSVTDRFSNKYEPVYMLVKSKKYWFDLDAVRAPYIKTAEEYESGAKGMRNRTNKNLTDGAHKPRAGGIHTQFVNPQNPLGKNPGDVWTIPTQPYPEGHFATFPTALIEPMIKAACPAEICPVCGLARERIVKTESFITRPTTGRDTQKQKKHPECSAGLARTGGHVAAKHTTVGWTSCDCNAGWIAGTVLDPFCGSGTVLEVARKLNLNAIGLELNPGYERLIKERSMQHTPTLSSYF